VLHVAGCVLSFEHLSEHVRISKNLTIDEEHLDIIEKEKNTGEMFLLSCDYDYSLFIQKQ